MAVKVDLNKRYLRSDGIVAREIHGEFILVPVSSGFGDYEDALFSMNETGRLIWDELSGKKDLKAIIKEVSHKFGTSPEQIKRDILGFVSELLEKNMLEVSKE